MPPAGFEPAIPASAWPQTHSLNRAATVFLYSLSCLFPSLSAFPPFGLLSCTVSLTSLADLESRFVLRFPYCGKPKCEIKWTGSQSDGVSSPSYRTCRQSSTMQCARNARAAKFLNQHCFVTSAGIANCNHSSRTYLKYILCVCVLLAEVGYEACATFKITPSLR